MSSKLTWREGNYTCDLPGGTSLFVQEGEWLNTWETTVQSQMKLDHPGATKEELALLWGSEEGAWYLAYYEAMLLKPSFWTSQAVRCDAYGTPLEDTRYAFKVWTAPREVPHSEQAMEV